MDPITLILTALNTGLQATAAEMVKDAYTELKTLIQRKFAGKPRAEMALTEYENDSKTWEAPLKKALVQEGVSQDPEVIAAAQQVMHIVQPQQAAMGKYNVQIAGNVYGAAYGDHQNIEMNFNLGSMSEGEKRRDE